MCARVAPSTSQWTTWMWITPRLEDSFQVSTLNVTSRSLQNLIPQSHVHEEQTLMKEYFFNQHIRLASRVAKSPPRSSHLAIFKKLWPSSVWLVLHLIIMTKSYRLLPHSFICWVSKIQQNLLWKETCVAPGKAAAIVFEDWVQR